MDPMQHWPGHERRDKSKESHHLEPDFWQWPHLQHGSIGRVTLVSKGYRRLQWSSVVDTSRDTRWLPLGKPTKIFPETRSPLVNAHERSTRQRAEKGMQYLRTYFPDADFPGELLGGMLEADSREMRRSKAFNPYLGNLLEILPSHHTQDEFSVLFPMGELGRQLNISCLSSDRSGNTVFTPAGSPSFAFETPILQITSSLGPSEWISTPSSALLIRTYTSSSLLCLERSKVTRQLDIARSDTGGVPIVDSRILASGPDIVVVNRNGKVYKCNTYHGSKAMQLIGAHEDENDDHFWQLSVTRRSDECFLVSHKVIEYMDFRSAGSVTNVFSLDHPSAVVTSFEAPVHDYISRVSTTSDVIWLDDRFRRRPLLSFKHYRSFDRTLRVLTAKLSGVSLSLLTSRGNTFVSLYDVSRGSDGLLHCNSNPSCLPHSGQTFTMYDGHALVALPSDRQLEFFRLCQRGSVHRQAIRVARPDEDQSGPPQECHSTYHWDEDVWELEKRAGRFQTDFGPVGGRHYTEVDLRSAYEKIFAMGDEPQRDMDQDMFEDALDRLPKVWQGTENTAENMLTAYELIFGIGNGNENAPHTEFFATNSKQAFDALMRGKTVTRELAGLARWHYSLQDTSIPAHSCHSDDCETLNEHLKELNLVSGTEKHALSVQRETEAREQLVSDLTLSNDIYSATPLVKPLSFVTGEGTMARLTEMSYSEEPPEIKFGFFHPVRKSGADHYADKSQDNELGVGVSSPLGVRLLLADWELGTDPNDYTYRDPYGLADMADQPIPRYRRLPTAPLVTQKKQVPPRRPPPVVAASQPPIVQTAEHARTTVQSQVVQRTHSRQFESDLDLLTQEPMMSTQVLPGPFGGRPATGKKPVKKRVGGF